MSRHLETDQIRKGHEKIEGCFRLLRALRDSLRRGAPAPLRLRANGCVGSVLSYNWKLVLSLFEKRSFYSIVISRQRRANYFVFAISRNALHTVKSLRLFHPDARVGSFDLVKLASERVFEGGKKRKQHCRKQWHSCVGEVKTRRFKKVKFRRLGQVL